MCPPHPPNLYVASFLSKFMYFNWGLITLQYCIGFAIYQHESATGIHVFPILNPPPSSLPVPSLWVIPVPRPKHPVSCIEPGLAIRFTYDIIHVSVPFSHIIPPKPRTTLMTEIKEKNKRKKEAASVRAETAVQHSKASEAAVGLPHSNQ